MPVDTKNNIRSIRFEISLASRRARNRHAHGDAVSGNFSEPLDMLLPPHMQQRSSRNGGSGNAYTQSRCTAGLRVITNMIHHGRVTECGRESDDGTVCRHGSDAVPPSLF